MNGAPLWVVCLAILCATVDIAAILWLVVVPMLHWWTLLAVVVLVGVSFVQWKASKT